MKTIALWMMLFACLCFAADFNAAYAAEETETEEQEAVLDLSVAEDSPAFVSRLAQAETEKREAAELETEEAAQEIAPVEQLFVVAATGTTTADVSMHQKDENGNWKQILFTSGLIGKSGLGKTVEGDMKTPVGTFKFNRAFGIKEDPGCSAFEYHQVTRDDYWSGDQREGYRYNEMVSAKDYPDLNKWASEHLIDYHNNYEYCLNISWNEECTPGKGSAIFLHCRNPYGSYTCGCVAIPEDQMIRVLQNVQEDCVVVIDAMENIEPEI